MSIKVLENLSMFTVVAVRVAVNGKGVSALENSSDALQALYSRLCLTWRDSQRVL